MNLRFVLVSSEHDMNVGAACRAIKNFGFAELWLVSPQCKLGLEAKKYAKHSEEVLLNARKVATLKEAIAGCDAAVGTTGVPVRYHGKIFKNCIPLNELYSQISKLKTVALVFGPEGTGLSEADTDMCDLVITIPTAPAHRVLNLSHAVSTCAYQLFLDSCKDKKSKDEIQYKRASEHKLAMLEKLFGDAVKASPTIRDKKKVAKAFQRLVKRSLPSEEEVSTLLCALDSFNSAEKYRLQKEKS
jgi:tRNA (cytidine32/uridine32-2'-O)-methyltransferase